MIRIKINLFWVALLYATAAYAGPDPYRPALPAYHSQPWCVGEFTKLHTDAGPYRNGSIAQVGPYYFRVCRAYLSPKINGQRVMRFFYNPRRVDDLQHETAMVGLVVNGLATWEKNEEFHLTHSKHVGYRQFGNVTYEIRQYISPGDDTFVGRKFFMFVSEKNENDTEYPPHFIDCSKELDRHPAESMNCMIKVGYGQIWANLQFIGGGPEHTPIPIDRFPIFAQDVIRILRTADVTKEVTAGSINLPRWD
ncbi:hypothetical protein FGK63_01450 [Ruegeria sediminis]|uniref:DUF3108 domain-containing protein n=1 Tax=Ruegeria sediminis TaxID=2583820 RepID=A0ABY2X4M8_9RHOB|nr:hypothetical protein [Ruegeria sediminis]TMV09762.1 hypothetical protein FGK63_01450 [Ruegeria sediminis]